MLDVCAAPGSKTTHLAALAPRYEALICDVWGVIHNGREAYPGVVECLTKARAAHKIVLLLSNAPRPSEPIKVQLESFGVPGAAYDGVVTSGDLTQSLFAARTAGWRGIFAVHTWIVMKPAGADAYTRYEVTGFGRPLRINGRPPDGYWLGDRPRIVADIGGALAAAAIPKIEAAIVAYPYAEYGDYRMWPGPNSNTFVATVLSAAPELAEYVAGLKQQSRKVVTLALRQLLRFVREYPREPLLGAVREAARSGLYDLDRLERMILRRVTREYFLLDRGPEEDD